MCNIFRADDNKAAQQETRERWNSGAQEAKSCLTCAPFFHSVYGISISKWSYPVYLPYELFIKIKIVSLAVKWISVWSINDCEPIAIHFEDMSIHTSNPLMTARGTRDRNSSCQRLVRISIRISDRMKECTNHFSSKNVFMNKEWYSSSFYQQLWHCELFIHMKQKSYLIHLVRKFISFHSIRCSAATVTKITVFTFLLREIETNVKG